MNPIKQKAPGSSPEPSKTRATASAVPRPNEQLNSGTVLEGAYDTRPEPLKNKANIYQMLSANGKHTLEVFTARENDGGDYQLNSNEVRRRLAEYNRANPKQSGEALSALAVWEYLHEKSGKSGTTYELTQADICFDLGLVTKSGSAKVKRLGELVAVLVEIGALFTDRAMYRTVSGEMAKGGGGGSGGGGGNLFGNGGPSPARATDSAKAMRLIELIKSLVEPEAWENDWAFIDYTHECLVVRAPDYVHRALGGYSFLPPSRLERQRGTGRYVSMTVPMSFSQLQGFSPATTSGSAGGNSFGTGGGGGPRP